MRSRNIFTTSAKTPPAPQSLRIDVGFPNGQRTYPAPSVVLSMACFAKETSAFSDEFESTSEEVEPTHDDTFGGGPVEGSKTDRRIATYATNPDRIGKDPNQKPETKSFTNCSTERPYLTILAWPSDEVSFIPSQAQVKWTQSHVFMTIHPVIMLYRVPGTQPTGSGTVIGRIDGKRSLYGLVTDTNFNGVSAFRTNEGVHTLQLYISGYKPLEYKVEVNYAKGPTIIKLAKGASAPAIIPAG